MSYYKNPEWYEEAFDKFPLTFEELLKRDDLISEGFNLPDLDGSKYSDLFDYLSTNNSFDKNILRKSLRDLYLNSSHKLIASNTDNVHFYKWEGDFSSWKQDDKFSSWYSMALPWDMFIYPGERDIFKLSQFYHRWITLEEMMNNWHVFKWTLMVFVNQRVASNYEIWIEEQEVRIRIRIPSTWYKSKLPVYIYKLDTNFQYRVKVTYKELNDFYKWEYPFSRIGDPSIAGIPKIILTFNQVLDEREPIADRTISDTLGDNLEFMNIDQTKRIIEVGQIHPINVRYLLGKANSSFWMGIISPKFFHEYPILLPTDIVYRSFVSALEPVDVLKNNLALRVKTDKNHPVIIEDNYIPHKEVKRDGNNKVIRDENNKVVYEEFIEDRLERKIHYDNPRGDIYEENVQQVYIDRFNQLDQDTGWLSVVRPIVISDSFKIAIEPYELIKEEMDHFRYDLTTFLKTTDEFIQYVQYETDKNEENWTKWMSLLYLHTGELLNSYTLYHTTRKCPLLEDLDKAFNDCHNYITTLNIGGVKSITRVSSTWINTISYINRECQKLIDRFYIADIIRGIPRKSLWYEPDEFDGNQRFHRPIDESGFMCFKYDAVKQTWYPSSKTFTRHYPDVYTMDNVETSEEIYKVFFFYSDTMNVREIIKPHPVRNPRYDEQLRGYQEAIADYKNIFMERFYWMAIKSVYDGANVTGCKWETIEYILGNESYRRFNDLFLNTVDPYFKLGLASHLIGNNTDFPFDDAIYKFNEQVENRWNGYRKVTNYEYYLNQQWSPSYFDFLETIYDDHDFSNNHRRRPSLTFNLNQLINELEPRCYEVAFSNSNELLQLNNILTTLKEDNPLEININLIESLVRSIKGINNGLENIVTYLKRRDREIYSLKELNRAHEMLSGFDYMVGSINLIISQLYVDLNKLTSSDDIVDDLKSIITKPVMWFTILELTNKRISKIIKFIEDMNVPFIPDPEVVSYKKVYNADIPDIIYAGFNYEINELVYIPGVGSYLVTGIDTNSGVRTLEKTGSNKVFRNPVRIEYYMTGSNKNGLDLLLNVMSTTITDVYDNGVLLPFIDRIRSLINNIKKSISNPNPHDNVNLENSLRLLESVDLSWERIKRTYKNNIDSSLSDQISLIVENLKDLESPCETYISQREGCDIFNLLKIFSIVVNDFNKYMKIDNWQSISSDFLDANINGQIALERIQSFYGYGTLWNDKVELISILDDIKDALSSYSNTFLLTTYTPTVLEILSRISECNYIISQTHMSLDAMESIEGLVLSNDLMNDDLLTPIYLLLQEFDQWFRFIKYTISDYGTGYETGDIVSINDGEYLFQITMTINGEAREIIPLMDYALEENIGGYFTPTNVRSLGSGMSFTILSEQVRMIDNEALLTVFTADPTLLPPRGGPSLLEADFKVSISPDQYDSADLFMYAFENIYDLNMKYEVFIAGKQILNFHQRHETNEDRLNANKLDVIYLNANMVNNLQNSSLMIPAEYYNIYRIAGIEITDPGAGYYAGQDVYVNTGGRLLKLKVVSIMKDPYKGIAEIIVPDDTSLFIGSDPSGINLIAAEDTMMNIDDEFHNNEYNRKFEELDIPNTYNTIGDPDYRWYLGHRIDNSIVGSVADRWYGLDDVEEVTNTFIDDTKRQDPSKPIRAKYKLISREMFHKNLTTPIAADLEVNVIEDLPRSNKDWLAGTIGMRVAVTNDTTHNYHRWIYKIKEFSITGKFRYDDGVLGDIEWNTFHHSFLETNTYIHDVSVNDLSVFNWTTKEWEDLSDSSRWDLTTFGDSFMLVFLSPETEYKYDMKLYLVKTFENQSRNNALIKPATFNILSRIVETVDIKAMFLSVFTQRGLRIRKLFPYEQINSYADENITTYTVDSFSAIPDTLSSGGGTTSFFADITKSVEVNSLNFIKNQYMHFRNNFQLRDLKLYNKTTEEFENILDTTKWRVHYRDTDRFGISTGYTTIVSDIDIIKPGNNYSNGYVLGYDFDTGLKIHGNIEVDGGGKIISFQSLYTEPVSDITTCLFSIFQFPNKMISDSNIMMTLESNLIDVIEDGYQYDIRIQDSIIPKQIKLDPLYDTSGSTYNLGVSLTSRQFEFVSHVPVLKPSIEVPACQYPKTRWYCIIDNKRYPLINPMTGKPTLTVDEISTGTVVTFNDKYNTHERLIFKTLPYHINSVYQLRKIPRNGYIDLDGKLNKPLSSRYYEFYVNGRLLQDEFTVVSPTVLILHGLTSLKNLEIIEVNRSSHEYLSDGFIEFNKNDRSIKYNFETYLDTVIRGTRVYPSYDRYSDTEVNSLFEPVFRQVDREHVEYKYYPENIDIEEDILNRRPTDTIQDDIYNPLFNLASINTILISGDKEWKDYGYQEITREELIEMLNEVFSLEINSNQIPKFI